jgi:hypothetical protein
MMFALFFLRTAAITDCQETPASDAYAPVDAILGEIITSAKLQKFA